LCNTFEDFPALQSVTDEDLLANKHPALARRRSFFHFGHFSATKTRGNWSILGGRIENFSFFRWAIRTLAQWHISCLTPFAMTLNTNPVQIARAIAALHFP
jgi:hypothetical protein